MSTVCPGPLSGKTLGVIMFCPECKSEYRKGFVECADCHVALVPELPATVEPDAPAAFVTIPGVSGGELFVVESLLQDEGVPYQVMNSEGGTPGAILIAEDTVPRVKQLLRHIRIRLVSGEAIPIPW